MTENGAVRARTSPWAPEMWRPFVVGALSLALSAGFGFGLALGLALALGAPLDAWWPAMAQAHGHVQLFGWAGLMVLGVGFHFLPRLRGVPLAQPKLVWLVLGLLLAGLVLRAIGQPVLALMPGATAAMWLLLPLSGLCELAGGLVALGLLVATHAHGPPVSQRAGLRPVLPFFAIGFAAFVLALAANALGLAASARQERALAPVWSDGATVLLGLEGFLLPLTVAMSMRTFPLYFRTHLPRTRLIQGGLVLWVAGTVLRVLEAIGWDGPSAAAELMQAAAISAFVVGLGVFARRVPLPRARLRVFSDPLQWHALTAHSWLALAGLLQLGAALASLGLPPLAIARDGERHALGAGFVTLLILGVGAHMLPGFAGRRLRTRRLQWATLALGNGAAVLRVAPTLWPAVPAGAFYGGAGLLGLGAVAAFALNVPVGQKQGSVVSPDVGSQPSP